MVKNYLTDRLTNHTGILCLLLDKYEVGYNDPIFLFDKDIDNG